MRTISAIGIALLLATAPAYAQQRKEAPRECARAHSAPDRDCDPAWVERVPFDKTVPHRFSGRYRPRYDARAGQDMRRGVEGVVYRPSLFINHDDDYLNRRELPCLEIALLMESRAVYRLQVFIPVLGTWTHESVAAAIDMRLASGRVVHLTSIDGSELVITPGAMIDDLLVRDCR
jgi:hypothetical protein